MLLVVPFLTTLLVAPASAQAPPRGDKLPRVAIFVTGPIAGQIEYAVKLFEQAMGELGFADGKNVALVREPPADRLLDDKSMQEHAAKVIRTSPDVVWLVNTENALVMAEAQKVSKTQIPVVASSVSDVVVTLGLANSLARPGKNFTGVLSMGEYVGAKRLELVLDLIPTLKRVGVLVYTPRDTSVRELELIEKAARARGISVVPAKVQGVESLEGAFNQLAKSKVQAVLTTHIPFFLNQSKRLVELAAERRLPLIGHRPVFAEQGAILSYGPDLPVQIKDSARLVVAILNGAKAGELPLQVFTKWELVINEKTARTLGLTIPAAVAIRVDRRVQ